MEFINPVRATAYGNRLRSQQRARVIIRQIQRILLNGRMVRSIVGPDVYDRHIRPSVNRQIAQLRRQLSQTRQTYYRNR